MILPQMSVQISKSITVIFANNLFVLSIAISGELSEERGCSTKRGGDTCEGTVNCVV